MMGAIAAVEGVAFQIGRRKAAIEAAHLAANFQI
jgi:hypothetical protein